MLKTFFMLFFFIQNCAIAIVDGEIIDDNSFNQSVALVFKEDSTKSIGEIYCSGTLIGPRTVVTVAHCFLSGAKAFKKSLNDFKKSTWVFLGSTHETSSLPFVSPQYKNTEINIYPQNDSIYSDLAVVILNEDIVLPEIYSISFPTKEMIGEELVHVGFGQIDNLGSKGYKSLMRLPLKQLTGYNGLGVGDLYAKGPSACHGDSGGSAYMKNKDGKLSFVGIEYGVSNHPCGESATYFIPLNQKIVDWLKSFKQQIYLN